MGVSALLGLPKKGFGECFGVKRGVVGELGLLELLLGEEATAAASMVSSLVPSRG